MVRKGSQVLQHLPASADAFVWLRLYQQELRGMVPKHPSELLWWTLRRPFRPLEYDAARMVFTRANQLLGANWTLHDLRHSAAGAALVQGLEHQLGILYVKVGVGRDGDLADWQLPARSAPRSTWSGRGWRRRRARP
ncbi:hypothetical protein [Streptomyces sp. NPDC047014]|uniref:hypothetical protein n=1 Tax=Streptomyces sp. NPDC047014 TaxID=3155736 RepID=UPI0034112613